MTVNYAGFLILAGILMLAAGWFAGQLRRWFDLLPTQGGEHYWIGSCTMLTC